MLSIIEWFKGRRRIKEEEAEAVAFTIAERINSKEYVEVSGVFDQPGYSTQIVQGLYDPETRKIVDAPPSSAPTGERAE